MMKVGSPLKAKFLGFSLYKVRNAGIRVHEKTLRNLKEKLKHLTRRTQGRSLGEVLKKLKLYVSGWLNYYALASMRMHLQALDQWLRSPTDVYLETVEEGSNSLPRTATPWN